MKGHSESIRTLAIINDNKFAVSGGDKDLRIWDIQERRQVFASTGHNNAILSLAVSKDNKILVTGSSAIGNNDYKIRIWDVQAKKQIQDICRLIPILKH